MAFRKVAEAPFAARLQIASASDSIVDFSFSLIGQGSRGESSVFPEKLGEEKAEFQSRARLYKMSGPLRGQTARNATIVDCFYEPQLNA